MYKINLFKVIVTAALIESFLLGRKIQQYFLFVFLFQEIALSFSKKSMRKGIGRGNKSTCLMTIKQNRLSRITRFYFYKNSYNIFTSKFLHFYSLKSRVISNRKVVTYNITTMTSVELIIHVCLEPTNSYRVTT